MKWILAVVIAAVLFCGCIDFGGGSESKDFTVKKLMDKYNYKTHMFSGYNEGDVIVVRDTIDTIFYDREIDRTLISFKSLNM